MPAAVPAIISGVVGSFSIVGGTLAFAGWGALFANTALSLVLSTVGSALSPKPKAADSGSYGAIKGQGVARQFRQAVTERRVVYGDVRVSGPVIFVCSNNDNKYLHLVIALASHEVQEIGEVLINDISVPPDALDGSGMVTTGEYANLIRIKKHLGTAGQTADADLVGVGGWTVDHRLRGIAYIYVRLEWNRDKFPSGIPNISAWVKGAKVLDPRDAQTRWTPNLALIARDYLCVSEFGLKVESQYVDDDFTEAAANTSDEFVAASGTSAVMPIVSAVAGTDIITLDGDRCAFQTGDKVQASGVSLPAGIVAATDYYVIAYQRKDTPRILLASSLADALAGTPINITGTGTGTLTRVGEPRYHGGGVINSTAEYGSSMQEILSGMAGTATYTGGKWRLLAGEYFTPTISFNEDDLVGNIVVQTKAKIREKCNRVQGVFTSPLNDGNPSTYPLVKNSGYEADDGRVLLLTKDLPFTQRAQTAQRIAKINLEDVRQEITFQATFKLTAFKVQVGDNFLMNFARYGWVNKAFRVIQWELSARQDGDIIVPVIHMTCKETAAAIFDWNNGEETQYDPAPNTTLPNPFLVEVVTGLTLTSEEVETLSGDIAFKIAMDWDAHPSAFVTEGGKFEIQFRKSSEIDWRSFPLVDGIQTGTDLFQASSGEEYDIRIRAMNNLNVRGNWATILGFVVGTSGGLEGTEDWRYYYEVADEFQDWGDWTGSITESRDWGNYS